MDMFKKLLLSLLLGCALTVYAAESININTADKETLMSIKGIGEKRAEAIIAYRKEHGSFKSVDELAEIKGLGPAFIESNRKNLTVGAPAN
jgi:competence protein ComEA